MAQNKKSFLLYCDVIHTAQKLTDEQAGILFKHILEYVNDLNPTPKDLVTEIAFEPIKQSLKRDLKKYENIRAKNKENALKRWNTSAYERIQSNTINAVSVSVSDSDIKLNISERKIKFFDSLKTFEKEYGKQMIEDFFGYWSEHGEKDKKMRFEKEKSYNIERRLKTWYNRNPKQYAKNGQDDLLNFINNEINDK